MTTLYAQPYDISATGFYFDTADQYSDRAGKLLNSYGDPVEEFEIQFIDGDLIDAELFKALSIHQGSFEKFLEIVDGWDADDKVKVIIAVGEVGYKFDLETDTPNQFDVDLYNCESLRDLAIQFVDEGLFGEIPASISHYVDYDAIARDLGMEYGEVTIDGTRYFYHCN